MMLWAARNGSSSFVNMKTPSSYELSGEDLDYNSYRSVVTGKLFRNIVGKKWISVSMTFNYLTESELEEICAVLNYSNLEVKLKSPLFGTSGIWQGKMYCSKYKVTMQQNKDNNQQTWRTLQITLVQSEKVSGQ